MTWIQSYTPLGNLLVSALVAAVPVCVLLGLLAFSKVHAHFAALIGLAASLAVAIVVYKMPWKLAGLATIDGAAYGLFPIGWIVLCAIFVYDITVHTGQFEIVKESIAGLADDRRIQAILIAFCFGSFIEGAAGFGTPVAISAAMLIGLGFRPLIAAGLALIGNTAPVAFGGLGTPILALAQVTGLPANALSAMIGRQLTPFAIIIPFWLIWAMAGWRRMLEVWPACLTAGLSFGLVQLVVSNTYGPWVVDIAASLTSIVSMLILLRFWQPKTRWRFDHETDDGPYPEPLDRREGDHQKPPAEVFTSTGGVSAVASHGAAILDDPSRSSRRHSRREMVLAWMPWAIVSVIVFTWGIPQVKIFLNRVSSPEVVVPMLHKAIFRAPPVVAKIKAEEAIFKFNWLSATGTSLMLAAILSALLLGIRPARFIQLFGKTLHRVRWSLLTISAMMAIGYTTRYAGLDATLGLAFASTGKLFPFFSPLLGWLGVALTGSDTASNVLFGNLQQITAHQLGLNPVLAASANSAGGVMGKMIDAQSIVVAGVATGQRGGEGQILRFVFFHSIALAVLVGLLVFTQAYWKLF
ncbi:MAG TPA: L-lactate permease [Tepidisphaeraceae bacterium]|jgi:lactate permease|nr:L-lactate permease [Tepidisphaeraceae bacterium]